MITYLASYPRSGNSLTQKIIQTFFERPITTDDQGSRGKGSQKAKTYASGTVPFVTNWRWPHENSHPPSRWDKLQARIFNNNLNRWIARYDLNVPPYTKNCPYLLPDCSIVLTPRNRQQLAGEDCHFFIKTHRLPFNKYFEGEYVIQPIRHPGAVLWSYFNLKKANGNTAISLSEEIKGSSWSNYHQLWQQAIPLLNGRLIRIRFEDVLLDPLQACAQISATIGLEYNPANKMTSFEELNQKDPKHFRAGQAKGWEEYYTDQQRQLLQNIHGSTMQQLGYEMLNPIKVAQ
ncbi:MAG: sulfotransferase domain-containing protein [Pleurocapsa sp.]